MNSNLITEALHRGFQMLPPNWQGIMDYHLRGRRLRAPYGGPMNGQAERRRIVETIIAAVEPVAIVETGTFRGVTTLWFAEFGRPVYTIELSPRYYAYCRRRLRGLANVTLMRGNSPDILRRLCASTLDPAKPVFFYLDAHWYDHLPLREECTSIFEGQPNSVVVVDDFQVPGDDGYTFDAYGPDKSLCLEHLAPLAGHGVSAFFPAAPSAQETGAKRGCVVLTVDATLAAVLTELQHFVPSAVYRCQQKRSSQCRDLTVAAPA